MPQTFKMPEGPTVADAPKGTRRAMKKPGSFYEYNDVRVNRLGLSVLRRLKRGLPEVFAERAVRAIQAGRSYVVIPWQMGVVAKLLRLLPNALFDCLMAGRGRKPRRS